VKHRSPTGRVTHVLLPPEPVQGAEPSADYTRVSRQLIARQNQHGRIRETVKVEGMGQSRLALNMTRVPEAALREQELVATQRQQGEQARGLTDSLGFEARARAAGAMGRVTPAMRFRIDQQRAERSYAYPRTTR
jgi:hypothetical protein